VIFFTLVFILSVLGFKSYSYSKAFENRETLFMDVIQKNPKAWMAHNILGILYSHDSQVKVAVTHFREAVRLIRNLFKNVAILEKHC
jgi:Tfp pilus assembly protein PilF